jgi:hypothetical protein
MAFAACFPMANAKRDPLRISEVKLRKGAVKMLLAAMRIVHTALEDREVAFDGVDVNRRARRT